MNVNMVSNSAYLCTVVNLVFNFFETLMGILYGDDINHMRGSRNFRQGGGGGPGQSDKKSSDNVF